jgi:hypothetical protein
MKNGFLIVFSLIVTALFTIAVPVDAGNLNKNDKGEQKRNYEQNHEKSKVHEELGREQRKHNVELEGEYRKRYEEVMRERRNKSKKMKREEGKERYGDIKGEEE